jgi:CheY-like chemotaxis protein
LARILHVDDDEFWRKLIRSRLGDHDVDSAESLPKAIDLLRSETSYDVALIDLNLAGDNDLQGGDLLDVLRIHYPHTRRILVTGSPPAGSVRRNIFERYDVDEIVIKRDMSLPDLRRVVEEAVARREGEPSESLRRSQSRLQQRFRDWRAAQADRLRHEVRAADGRARDAANVSLQSRQFAEMTLAAVRQREADFRLASDRLQRQLEDIGDEQQLAAAEAALGAAEVHFASDAERPRIVRTRHENAGGHFPHDDDDLPEPDPAEVRLSVGARAAECAVGDVLDGRFEILGVVGQGGFSRVYRVRDDVEGEERALKLFDSAAGYEAVRREIGALRKIRHPHVVEVFWAGRTGAGDWYLVTEFVEGESLDEFVTGKKHLRDREAVDVALDLLDALTAFHPDSVRLRQLDAARREGSLPEAESREWEQLQDSGLVHRDIKPLNVILTRTGAKLLDFNIASRVGDPVHTKSGTPPYQPPDAGLTRWDVSTDLFAVGVLLYQLLCNGHHPFPGAMPAADEPVTDPGTFRPDLPAGLAAFLSKACAPVSADRYSTAAEMQSALRNIRADL